MRHLSTLLLALALTVTGCTATTDSDSFNPADGSEVLLDELNEQKNNGAFGAEQISLGDSATGEATGSAFTLFEIRLVEQDRIKLTVERTSGDLDPSAYLYRGTQWLIQPDSFDKTADKVELNYEINGNDTYYIAVKAYRQRGTGGFELTTECTGGQCAGMYVNPNELVAASDCIVAARDCALAELPSRNGRVGEVTAQNIFTSCLDDASTELGYDCSTACEVDAMDDAMAQEACDHIVSLLPGLADQPGSCVSEFTECLSECEFSDAADNVDVDTFDYTTAHACVLGYFGNCTEFMEGHVLCGGTYHAEDGANRCYAICESVNGAFGDGPHYCPDCDDICVSTEQECDLECDGTMDPADPDEPDPACIEGCMERYNSDRCETF